MDVPVGIFRRQRTVSTRAIILPTARQQSPSSKPCVRAAATLCFFQARRFGGSIITLNSSNISTPTIRKSWSASTLASSIAFIQRIPGETGALYLPRAKAAACGERIHDHRDRQQRDCQQILERRQRVGGAELDSWLAASRLG